MKKNLNDTLGKKIMFWGFWVNRCSKLAQHTVQFHKDLYLIQIILGEDKCVFAIFVVKKGSKMDPKCSFSSFLKINARIFSSSCSSIKVLNLLQNEFLKHGIFFIFCTYKSIKFETWVKLFWSNSCIWVLCLVVVEA